MLIEVLGHYGELLEDILEELFDDGGTGDTSTEGMNHTGMLNLSMDSFKVKCKRIFL